MIIYCKLISIPYDKIMVQHEDLLDIPIFKHTDRNILNRKKFSLDKISILFSQQNTRKKKRKFPFLKNFH